MIFSTDRLLLRPWAEADAESLYENARDSRVGPIAGWPVHTGVENSREIIRGVLSAPETYAVCLKEDNRAIGSIGLMVGKQSNLDLPDTEGELGFWIGVPFWGQGLIPEAARALIRRAFADLGLQTLWCGYFDGNGKSRRVQEKCGFVYHHTNRDVPWPLMGDVRTEHVTRLTREDWIKSFSIRALSGGETDAALALAWRVFSEYEAPDYAPEGIEEFRRCLHDEAFLAGIDHYGVFDGDALIGELGFRPDRRHICLFFVDGGYHRLGVGTRLFRRLLDACPGGAITVNSSPYGLPFYRRLGFTPTAGEQTVHGIRFFPMIYSAEKSCAQKQEVLMKDFIAYCGLDCETCEARIATVNGDEALRRKVAKRWSELNGVEITPEMINCDGCRVDGRKTPYCEALCPIRQCALERGVATCGDCAEMDACKKVGMVIGNNAEALNNLKA